MAIQLVTDIGLATFRTPTLCILLYLVLFESRRILQTVPGWYVIKFGVGIVLLGSILNIGDKTHTQSLLTNAGYWGSIFLLAYGVRQLITTMISSRLPETPQKRADEAHYREPCEEPTLSMWEDWSNVKYRITEIHSNGVVNIEQNYVENRNELDRILGLLRRVSMATK
jgi:hypothetical protein